MNKYSSLSASEMEALLRAAATTAVVELEINSEMEREPHRQQFKVAHDVSL